MNRIQIRLLALGLAGMSVAISLRSSADEPKIVERFEGVEPSWTIRANANALFVHKHLRTSADKRSGAQSEFIHLKTSKRADSSLTHAIGPALVINDFCPYVWLKSNQDHIKLFARVVLPKTPNPVGDGPLKVLVELGHSTVSGQWQRLGCRPGELVKNLNSRLFNIQFQFKELTIDRADAYCDLIALKGFSKPNTEYQIWLDDICHVGLLPAKVRVKETNGNQVEQAVQKVELKDSQFRVNGRPFFVRAIEHNGESFAFLKQLGFNSVVLTRLPTPTELEQAQQYQLWIICPPILSENDSTQKLLANKNLDMVFAWNIGSNLTSGQLRMSKEKCDYLKRYQSIIDRPTVCHAYFPVKKYAQFVDAQRIRHQVYGTTFQLSALRQTLSKRQQDLRAFWVDIQTRLPKAVLQQSRQLPDALGEGFLTAHQVRQMTFEALLNGARGIVFQSNNNLENKKEYRKWLAPIFKSINRELIQIDPWIAGGLAHKKVQKSHASVTFELPRSQITLVQTIDLHLQTSAGSRNPVKLAPPRTRNQILQISTTQKSPRIYKITETGFVPVQHISHIGNLKVELGQLNEIEKFVVSEDSLSFEYIQKCTNSFASDGGLLQDRFEVLQNSYERLMEIVDAVTKERINSPRLFVSISEIKSSMDIIQTFLENNQLTSAQEMIKTVDAKLHLVCASIQQELATSRTFISSPFNSDFSQLANYIQLEKMIQGRNWSRNLIPHGSFEKLSDLSKSGWSQHLNSSSVIQSSVSLVNAKQASDDSVQIANKAIQIQTWNQKESDDLVEVTPVWISTPKVRIPGKHLVRVEGYVQIQQPIQNSIDGFMVIDSIGGPELGCRFQQTDGWKYFAIERITRNDHDFGLVFAQTGLGSVQFANIQVRICDLRGSLVTESQPAASKSEVLDATGNSFEIKR